MQKFGIDVSRWQGNFDFGKAKSTGNIEFAILKIGGADDGLYKDSAFENNFKKCKEKGIPVGAYYFGCAMNVEEAKEEARHFINLLEGKQYEYPVFYDVEARMLTLENDLLTEICKTVLSMVEDAGYWVGIYASSNTFNFELNDRELAPYSHWVASWSEGKPFLGSGNEVQMWQFGGEINRIRSNKINGQTVDQNYCYVDYPAKIKELGLNGYKKEEIKVEVKPVEVPKVETSKQATFTLTKDCYTFWAVSQKFGCSVAKIAELNPKLNPNNLYVGQVINVPGVVTAEKPTTKKYELTRDCYTFWAVSQKLGCSIEELQKLNPNINANNLCIGQIINVPNVE